MESQGCAVEIDGSPSEYTPRQLLHVAEETLRRVVAASPKLSMGFGSQLVERTHDLPVQGGGAYEYKPTPATGGVV